MLLPLCFGLSACVYTSPGVVSTQTSAVEATAAHEDFAAGDQGSPEADADAEEADQAGSYRTLLREHLVKHQRYPLTAHATGVEGDAMIRVVIDRDGRVQSRTVEPGFSDEIFAREVEAMVDRANPFPPAPENFEGEAFEFLAPIQFRLVRPEE